MMDPSAVLGGIQKMFEERKKRELVTSRLLTDYTAPNDFGLNETSTITAEPKSALRSIWDTLTQFDTSGLNPTKIYDTERRKVGPTISYERDTKDEGPIERKEVVTPYNPQTPWEQSTPALTTVSKIAQNPAMDVLGMPLGVTLKSEKNLSDLSRTIINSMVRQMSLGHIGDWEGTKGLPKIIKDFMEVKYPLLSEKIPTYIRPRLAGDTEGYSRGFSGTIEGTRKPATVLRDAVPTGENVEELLPEIAATWAHETGGHGARKLRGWKLNEPSPYSVTIHHPKIKYEKPELNADEVNLLRAKNPGLSDEKFAPILKKANDEQYDRYYKQLEERRARKAGVTGQSAWETVVQSDYDKAGYKTLDLTKLFTGKGDTQLKMLRSQGYSDPVINKILNDPKALLEAKGKPWDNIVDKLNLEDFLINNKDHNIGTLSMRHPKYPDSTVDEEIISPLSHMWRKAEREHARKFGFSGQRPTSD